MAKKPVNTATASKSDQAYSWIRDQITEGRFTPGYRLVLSTLAKELDVSVVPVREAIRLLEAEGLVTFEKNVGAYVRMIDRTQYEESMYSLAIVEAAATALSAPALTEEDIDRSEQINRDMYALLDRFDPREFTALNKQFHHSLLLGCENEHLMEMVTNEWALLGNLRDSTFTFVPARARQSVQEHERILNLIKNKAPAEEIEAVARAHRLSTLDAYKKSQQRTQ